MDPDSFVTEVYVIIDDWWQQQPESRAVRVGRPAQLAESEVLALAVLGQWPRWRCERDFARWACRHLRSAFPGLGSQSQLNRSVRRVERLLVRLQADIAQLLAVQLAAYQILDTTLVPAMRRVRACRHGLFVGEAAFGRCATHTEWVYGFKLALSVTEGGVIAGFGLAAANTDERPIGDALIAQTRHHTYLADKGYASVDWERHWLSRYGAVVVATPNRTTRRAWSPAACRWSAGRRQTVEQVIGQLKDLFALERHRAKTLLGLRTRLAAKILAYTLGQLINLRHGRPLRQLADLLV